MSSPRVPRATYRLQLGPDLSFDDAAALVPYLAALGVSDCYLSPFFETSSPGSHGYDVSDHNRLREELGGEAAFARLAAALERHGLGLLIDLVPNHMGIAHNRNAFWQDVLEYGPGARYAPFFDIDWAPVKRELENRVLLPILGEQYGAALDAGQLRLELADGACRLRYYDTVLPLSPVSYGRVLSHRIETLQAELGAEHPGLVQLKSLVSWFVTIPRPGEPSPAPEPDTPPENEAERFAARERAKALGITRLHALLKESSEVRAFVDENIRRFNGEPGDARSHDMLDRLLADQAYRVAFWRVAGEEINYRRFFDINELAAIRMEDPRVFEETHRLLRRLVCAGSVTGLRIDHPDGLYAPAEYLARLHRLCADEGGPRYIVAEKILAPGERLPESWPVAGTTGYEFLNLLNGLFVDRTQARAVDDIYTRLLRHRPSFNEIVYQCKRLIMETSMASELGMLAHRLNVISEKHRSSRDFTLGSLTSALREIIASFPVYRTYVGDGGAAASAAEREYIDRAITLARRRTPLMDASVYDWIRSLLLLEFPSWATEADRAERADWVMRFQQMTGPVMAKGYEDTALYRYNRLVSLNEVGGDPSRFGTAPAEFHAAMVTRQAQTPHGLSALATHDTKRGEDVRARINVLSEIPREWRAHVGRWQRLNRRHHTMVDGEPVPGPNEEYLLYQTLVGAWPVDGDRLAAYVLKAAHEAKAVTSWMNPNARYDDAVTGFARGLLDPRRSREFLRDFTAFAARVAHFGAFNSLAQTLVKITAPGVPDCYQGGELWDLNLVDPDNRRAVDWARRRRLLDELIAEIDGSQDLAALARELVKTKDDGRVKLYLIRQALAVRRQHEAVFATGAYRPLEVVGPLAEHACAFARVAGDGAAVTVVPRFLARRGIEDAPLGGEYWGADTRIVAPPELGTRFANALTAEAVGLEDGGIPLARAFQSFPVALLVTPR